MSKYQTLVGSSATNLYGPPEDIDTINNTISSMCFKPDYPHTSALIGHMYNGMAIKAHQIYTYGRDHYFYGLPEGYSRYLNETDPLVVEVIIEAEVGYDIDLQDMFLSEPDGELAAQSYCKDNYGWDPINGTFTKPPVSGVGGSKPEYHSGEFDKAVLRITFYLGEENSRSRYGVVSVTDHGFKEGKLYYHARYHPRGGNTSDYHYWFYEKDTGRYPVLDYEDETLYGSPFMPVIPLREDNVSLGPECSEGEYVRDSEGNLITPDTELYRTSVQLCKKAGTDFNELTREISSNPDVDQVDHAYLIFGIDIRSSEPASKHYLFQFFEDIILNNTNVSEVEVRDANYRIKISFSSAVRVGIVGEDLGTKTKITYQGNDLILERKIDDNEYTRVTVSDLEHTNYVSGNHTVVTSLSDSADEDNYNFIVPLQYSLIKKDRYMFDRENLMKESFKIVFNSVERRKLKWYERGFFKFLLVAITVVIAVFTGPFAGLTAAFATGIQAGLLYVLQIVLYMTAIQLGFRILAKYVDPALLAVIAAVVLTLASTNFSALNLGSTTAESLLTLSNNLVQGIGIGLEAEMANLQEDMDSFFEYAKDLDDELDLLEEELSMNNHLLDLPSLIMEPMFIPNETPDSFYARTIHAGNIGVQSLNIIESYVDTQLTLPKLR